MKSSCYALEMLLSNIQVGPAIHQSYFPSTPGWARGCSEEPQPMGRGKKTIRKGKKQAMLAERRDRLCAARDGGH